MSKYFQDDEFTCNCGCGTMNISDKLVEILDAIRESYGKPIKINSACRCPAYNMSVGGKDNSAHIATDIEPCEAGDIRCGHSNDRFLLIKLAVENGINRIGVSFKGAFLHLDIDKNKPSDVIWGY